MHAILFYTLHRAIAAKCSFLSTFKIFQEIEGAGNMAWSELYSGIAFPIVLFVPLSIM